MIDENIISEVTDKLVKEFNPEKIILFGSYAWGNPTEESDLDILVIITDSKEKQTMRMTKALQCLRGFEGIPKDILVKTHYEAYRFKDVIASLEYKIFREGKILYNGA